MRTPRIAVAVTAALVLGIGASSADAATKKPAPVTAKSVNTKVNDLAKTVGSLKTDVDSFKVIANAAPQIIDGLTQLKDGLTKLGTLALSTEYGALGIYTQTDGVGPGTLIGVRAVSADIPDSGNTAYAGGQFPSGYPAVIYGHTLKLSLRAAIRSAEADGKSDTGPPAGEVGGVLYAICASSGGCGTPDGNPAHALTSGAIICSPGQTPANTYSLPDGTSTSQNLVPIQRSAGLTDTSAPGFALPETGGTGTDVQANCSIPSTNQAYTFIVVGQAQFADIPDSLSPGPAD